MKKLLGIVVLVLGLAYNVNSNAGEKIDLIFCTSDMTKYQYSEYSDVYLKDAFGGTCPSSKPSKISYKQFSQLRTNHVLCYNKTQTVGLRVYFVPYDCERAYGGGGILIKYDGKQFYIGEGAPESKETAQTDDSSNVDLAKDLIKIPVHVHILEINEKRYKTKTKPKHVEVHFRRVNKIWSKANIFWDLKKIDYIPADTTNFKSNVEWIYKNPRNKKNNTNKEMNKRKAEIMEQLLQIKRNQKHGHINVYYIPYIFDRVCGYMQGFVNKKSPKREYLVMGHIMNPKSKKDRKFCKVQGIILAHELGHMLYLDHHPQKHFLMGIYGGVKISEKNIIEARKNYKNYLKEYLE